MEHAGVLVTEDEVTFHISGRQFRKGGTIGKTNRGCVRNSLRLQSARAEAMNRKQAVDQMKAVACILSSDIERIIQHEDFVTDEAAHRSVIRAHFAFIEGMVYQLRSVALASGADLGIYSPDEIAVLREDAYSLDNKGKIKRRDSFEKMLPMILFSMRAYARIHGATFEPDTSVHGWEAMKKYVSIRNALAHPKTVDDLTVTEEKTKISGEATAWFQDNLKSLLDACADADKSYGSEQS